MNENRTSGSRHLKMDKNGLSVGREYALRDFEESKVPRLSFPHADFRRRIHDNKRIKLHQQKQKMTTSGSLSEETAKWMKFIIHSALW